MNTIIKSRIRSNKKRHISDLDVTPFMNLMVVLVPVLLLTFTFTKTTVINLTFPRLTDETAVHEKEKLDKSYIEIILREKEIIVADKKSPLREFKIDENDNFDAKSLVQLMKELKTLFPAKRNIVILLEPEVSFATLVNILDYVRSYKAVLVTSVVDAELFPEVSLGTAPPKKG